MQFWQIMCLALFLPFLIPATILIVQIVSGLLIFVFGNVIALCNRYWNEIHGMNLPTNLDEFEKEI